MDRWLNINGKTEGQLRRMNIPKLQRYLHVVTNNRNVLAQYMHVLDRELTDIKRKIVQKQQEIAAYQRVGLTEAARSIEADLLRVVNTADTRQNRFDRFMSRLEDFELELADINNVINEKMLPLRNMQDLRDRELMRTHNDELEEYYDDGYATDSNEYE